MTTPKGVRILALPALGAPSGIFNTKKPVNTVAEMASLRMRALDETQIKLYKAWGSNGTIVSWSEVPNALQTGIADRYMNPPMIPIMCGHTDFIKHFTDARVSAPMRVAMASESWYQGLSKADRAIVDEAAQVASSQLPKVGIEVVRLTPAARAEFTERSKSAYPEWGLSAADLKVWLDAAMMHQ